MLAEQLPNFDAEHTRRFEMRSALTTSLEQVSIFETSTVPVCSHAASAASSAACRAGDCRRLLGNRFPLQKKQPRSGAGAEERYDTARDVRHSRQKTGESVHAPHSRTRTNVRAAVPRTVDVLAHLLHETRHQMSVGEADGSCP